MSVTTGLNRDTIDKFYTNESAVNLCCSLINEKLSINSEDLIIEPSAGNGSFIEAIKLLSPNHKFYDLKPENPEIIEQDYLDLNYMDLYQLALNSFIASFISEENKEKYIQQLNICFDNYSKEL